jgi:hypothetical protein
VRKMRAILRVRWRRCSSAGDLGGVGKERTDAGEASAKEPESLFVGAGTRTARRGRAGTREVEACDGSPLGGMWTPREDERAGAT